MSLKTRLARLETQSAPERVWGVQIDDGPVTRAGEEMTREAFDERYPACEIIHFVIVNSVSPDQCSPMPASANN